MRPLLLCQKATSWKFWSLSTEAYERRLHYLVNLPDPIEAIKFRLEQSGMDYQELIGVIGQRTRVYEVMRRKPAAVTS